MRCLGPRQGPTRAPHESDCTCREIHGRDGRFEKSPAQRTDSVLSNLLEPSAGLHLDSRGAYQQMQINAREAGKHIKCSMRVLTE